MKNSSHKEWEADRLPSQTVEKYNANKINDELFTYPLEDAYPREIPSIPEEGKHLENIEIIENSSKYSKNNRTDAIKDMLTTHPEDKVVRVMRIENLEIGSKEYTELHAKLERGDVYVGLDLEEVSHEELEDIKGLGDDLKAVIDYFANNNIVFEVKDMSEQSEDLRELDD